ncbi:hypothetical protein [Streptomyces lonarensis]|uniref:Uncharacterized protein n=1 Tax=Streptomyces lonarensis TaxID=700599 RepID=A0A7X6D229_9ACTN|nr:hypothetical protein [Streptomyces lonarensis]NJQ06679.1 hypothetical protein [Streptomyces lonarensis]
MPDIDSGAPRAQYRAGRNSRPGPGSNRKHARRTGEFGHWAQGSCATGDRRRDPLHLAVEVSARGESTVLRLSPSAAHTGSAHSPGQRTGRAAGEGS